MVSQIAALSIAGLDPSGGAGIAADLRAFAAAGVWGCAACAALTVQSTRGVHSVHPVPVALVIAQIREVLADVPVRAMKTGALGSAATALAVAALLRGHPRIPSVVDPVMVPSRRSGSARLDGRGAVGALLELGRAATLVTPNLLEAGAMLGRTLVTSDDARAAASALVVLGARAVLVKGGHARGARAVDWFATRNMLVPLARGRLRSLRVHGAGCTLAALIAGRLAATCAPGAPDDDELLAAIRWARARHGRALRSARTVGGGMLVLAPTPSAEIAAGPGIASKRAERAERSQGRRLGAT